MISIIITSYKEPKTIGKAILSIIKQKIPHTEILVVAPDTETLEEAKKFEKKYSQIRLIKDLGQGKPAALNLAVSKAKGDILVFTDGDVYVGEKSLFYLLEPFKDANFGAVTGRPIPLNPKTQIFGYWAYALTNVADEVRKNAVNKNKQFFCSGYLFAIRKPLFPSLPENLLSEDGFISLNVYKKGYRIAYAPLSKVYVKYPDNFSDWIKQKKRSAGGYNQIKKISGVEMRSFRTESLGAFRFFKYASNPTEFFWLAFLFFSRLYLWAVIYKDINLIKKTQKQLWQRVESTK